MAGMRLGTFNCVDCGLRVCRRVKVDKPMVCFECGLLRAEAAARALQSRQGPQYERFLANRWGKVLPPPPEQE